MRDCCASFEMSVAGSEADAARDFGPCGGKWADEGFGGAAVVEGGTGVFFLAFSMANRTSWTNCRRTWKGLGVCGGGRRTARALSYLGVASKSQGAHVSVEFHSDCRRDGKDRLPVGSGGCASWCCRGNVGHRATWAEVSA